MIISNLSRHYLEEAKVLSVKFKASTFCKKHPLSYYESPKTIELISWRFLELRHGTDIGWSTFPVIFLAPGLNPINIVPWVTEGGKIL